MKDIFEKGLEAVEIPIEAISTQMTPTETALFQVILLNSDRSTGRIHKAKVADYARWTQRNEMSIYKALSGLNEKGFIETEIRGWVKGTVLMRYINKPKSEYEVSEVGAPLGRALVHRQALKIMIALKLSGLTQRVYWDLATQIDVFTGEIHERQIDELAERFGVSTSAIYKAIRQLNAAGLSNIDVDFGVTGHLPHVALAYGVIRLAVERKIEEAKNGRHATAKFEQYKTALYKLFGVPIKALTRTEIQHGIAALKEKLDPYVEQKKQSYQQFQHV